MQQLSSARKDKKGMNIPYQNEKPVSKNVCWTHTQVHVYMFFKVDLEILHFVPNNHKTAAHIQPSSSSPVPLGQFQPNLAQSIRWYRRFEFDQMERPYLFTLGDNNKIAKVLSRNLKILSS